MEYRKIMRTIMGDKKTNLLDKINLIKHNVNSGEFREAIMTNPIVRKHLFKQPYFKDVEDIHIKYPFKFSEDLKTEFKWIIVQLEQYFDEIDSFLSLKNDYEKLLIIDKYEEARTILIKIEERFGISLWSIEANLYLTDRIEGTNENWGKLSKYLNSITNSIYEFIINSSSKRVEVNMSFESFLNQFQNDIDTINADGILEDFFVFKNFNYPNYEYRYKNLESVIYVSNAFSVIDQYLLLIEVIIFNIIETRKNDNIYESFLRKAKRTIKNDPRIYNIYNLINKKGQFDESNQDLNFIKCMDEYYLGNFEKAFELSKIGISQNPMEFQFYEVYCKSLINLDANFEPLKLGKTINNILQNLYNLFSFDKNEKTHFTNLLNISSHLMNTNLGVQIFSLLSEIEGTDNRHYIRALMASNYCTYKFLFFSKYRSNNLSNLEVLTNSHSFKVNMYKLGFEISFSSLMSNSKIQVKSYQAFRYYKLMEYQKAIEILKNDEELDKINYYYDRKIGILFRSYLKLNLLSDALLLFGEVFFNENFKTRKVKDFELFNDIIASTSKPNLYSLIELPILMSIHTKEYDLYEVYDEFLLTIKIENIQDIDIDYLIKSFGINKAIYFLENVATIDTIKYSTDYTSISDVEEVRIQILKNLIKYSPNKKEKYQKEIDEIYRINSVRKVLKEVDEGRLYIDVDSLKRNQVKKFKDDFKRFKEIEQSASVQGLIGFNAANQRNWHAYLEGSSYVFDSYNTADYLAFKNIYLESRENFLFSKEYGLDSSLSTRIRHGALKNHIRSVFEKYDLVTSKLNNVYRENEVWEEQLKDSYYLNLEVQQTLKVFSEEIDTYSQFVVEKLIQIQTEKTKDKDFGIFRFYVDDIILYEYYLRNKHNFDSIETIIDMLLTSLVNHMLTDVQIDVRKQFTGTIWQNFESIIEKASTKLRSLDLPNDCQLIPNMTKSSTEIQKELEVISDWFYLNTTNSATPLRITDVINASVELTNKINPNSQITPKVIVDCEVFGVYSSVIFVFNILFNNVIIHSKLPQEQNEVDVQIELYEKKYYVITFKNKLKEGSDYSKNIERLNKVKKNWNDHQNIDRSNKESQSGFDKIKRILLYEAFSKTDKFDFNIDSNSIEIKLFFPRERRIISTNEI